MSQTKAIPASVKRAASKFHKSRADYFQYLAHLLRSAKGTAKFEEQFQKDAQRYPGLPRGVLSSYWAETYQQNGANLAETWDGTFPTDEVAIIRVAQTSGGDAIIESLDDVARNARLNDRMKRETLTILLAAIIGSVIAALMLTVFAVFSSEMLQDMYKFIPLSEWGPMGRSFVNYAANVRSFGLYVLLVIALCIFIVNWSINNYTGGHRDWLDRKVVLYRTVRDVKGALFLSTMATLTRRRSSGQDTLVVSLQTLLQSIRSPWLKWRVEEVVTGIESSGAVSSDAFHTNLLSDEMFFYLRDTQEAQGFSAGFEATGHYVEQIVVDSIVKKLNIYRWAILLSCVLCVIYVMTWQSAVIYEMKGVMSNYYSSR